MTTEFDRALETLNQYFMEFTDPGNYIPMTEKDAEEQLPLWVTLWGHLLIRRPNIIIPSYREAERHSGGFLDLAALLANVRPETYYSHLEKHVDPNFGDNEPLRRHVATTMLFAGNTMTPLVFSEEMNSACDAARKAMAGGDASLLNSITIIPRIVAGQA